jgi:DHA1 family tetracycline resistance protein-like MFS transporter
MPPKEEYSTSTEHLSNGEEPMISSKSKKWIHPALTLVLLNAIDMFSVALVVPLLHQYFKEAGVTNASLRELLSALFSGSQIIGGLVIGGLSDSGLLSRKRILYASFLGSALSYSLIVYGGIKGLIISRIIVGAVKQTSTISTAMIASYTTNELRSMYLGKIGSAATLAFMVGPAVGGYLFKHVDTRAPALLASSLFLLNFALATILLPNEERVLVPRSKKSDGKFAVLSKNLKACFTSKTLSNVVLSSLLYGWFTRATSYASMASYYEEMFGIEPYQRGYLSSYQSVLSFLFQSFFVQYTLHILGNEYRAACCAAFGIVIATMLEFSANLYIFIGIISPIISVSNSVLRLSIQSLVTQVAPKESLSSILAALDVLQNVASVSVPFYRTILFKIMSCCAKEEDHDACMLGDPCPTMWLQSSLVHWIITSLLLCHLLLKQQHFQKEKIKYI